MLKSHLVAAHPAILLLMLFLSASCVAQKHPTTTPAPAPAQPAALPDAPKPQPAAADDKSPTDLTKDVNAALKQAEDIQAALKKEDPEFALVLGIGSLVVGPGVTDYQNESNVIRASSLGRATPQFITGVSFRSKVPNLRKRWNRCEGDKDDTGAKPCPFDTWQRWPWSGFVSLKFSPGASQTVNGYVIGGTYAFAHYLNALIGFSLTPINEPAPGFRTAAAQFVTQQQQQGLDLNFDPNAMRRNDQNAFDGFPVIDSTGRLIYQGNPLTIHYRGGVVFGISMPIYFGSVFKSGSSAK